MEALFEGLIAEVGRVGARQGDLHDSGNYAWGDDTASMGRIAGVHKDQHSGIDGKAGEIRGEVAVNRMELSHSRINSEVLREDLLFELGEWMLIILGPGELFRRDGNMLAGDGHGQRHEGVECHGGAELVVVVEGTEGGGECKRL